jgi:hypothetical protein
MPRIGAGLAMGRLSPLGLTYRVVRLGFSAYACAMVLASVGCGGSDPIAPSGYAVTAQVIDSRTGQPVSPPKAAKRPPPEIPSARAAEPVFRKLEPIPDAEPGPDVQTAPPQRSPEEEALIAVARERPFLPVEARVGGQAVVMNFVGGDDRCRTVAVTYPARRVAELWRVCSDGQYTLDREAEAIPDLPNDPGLQAARQAAAHWAYANNGRGDSAYGELMIRAQASGQKDQNGCMVVRNAVTWNGITIGVNDDTVCSTPE